MRWEKVQVNLIQGQGVFELSGPGKRWGHSCNAIKGGKLLYVFGGYSKDNCQTNQVHVFDTVKQTWILPVIKGIPPTPRDSHSCTTVGDNLFVFGGTDGMSPLKDLHILDTSTNTWISPSIRGEGPEAREGHSAALVGKRLFIFGGCGKSADNINEVYFNDLYILNTETFVWKCAATSGTPPSPRDSHTCSSWKNKVIVIGGEDGHDYYLSDVHILDTDTLIWRELNVSGQLLPPRAGHSTVSFGRNLFVFGGFTDAQNLYNDLYMLDVETGIWTKVGTAGNGPSARFSVSGDCLDPFKGGVLVFIGGCNKSLEALDDMFYLYTGLARETEHRPEKLSLRKQLKLKCQEQNLNTVQNQARQNIPMHQSMPTGKQSFQAKVTESISEGYSIETVIDGKPLRGILFLNKPNFLHPATLTSSRKRIAAETCIVIPIGMHPNKLKISKALKQDEIEERLIDGVQRDGSASNKNHTEAFATLLSSNPTSDASKPLKVSVREPEAVCLNQDYDKKNIIPISLGEDSRNDVSSSMIDVSTANKANDMPSSTSDVSTDDKTIDVPSSKTYVPTDGKTGDVPSSSAGVPMDVKIDDAPVPKTGIPTDDRTNDAVPSSDVCVPTNDKTNDAPVPENAVPTGNRTNDALVSKSEVPRHNQTSDEPICKNEVLKPAAVESLLSLSNQDCPGPMTEKNK